ncbi:TnsD family Tn7-like transposition protein [Neobacillus sp. OS1-2]|uniref:TnsD family Tn7-like transposition protein n=1 Tax=Neobacillus sp. OS1-2 TaxID=3070680 RepID=UPI0027DEF31D|nr:TnsD family Tn7-like transposition protein [Neobacillus sp. OS1-2]WML42281.1 TnsD family Tn7-like transposition protein [Neobacillus sp. OS1-2]
MLICSKHKKALIESHIPYRNKQNKHKFFTLNETSIKLGKIIIIPERFFDKFLFIADTSYRLLNEKELLTGVDNLQEFYLKKLQEKGYITKSKRIRMQELKSVFLKSFDSEFLRMINSSFNLGDENTWFHKVLRKPRVTCYPLRHLLLLLFLNEAFPNNSIKDNLENYPFGKGPWPCLNKAANHYKELLITECVVTTDSKTKQPVGTFACSQCHFIYSRRGPDYDDKDIYKIGRVKNFGIVWINKLNELGSNGKYSTRKISLILGVDSKTVKKYLENDKGITKDKLKKIKNERIIKEETAEKHKKDLLILINDNPGFSRTELRKVNPSGYIWLYRNHREWLLKNLPNPKISHKTTAKINWDQRDEEYSFLLIKEAINILTEEPLIRLTKTRIAKRLDLQSRFEKNIDKLPICKSILDDVTEDIEDFQIRRIRLRAEGLRKENFYYSKSTLGRAAGLGKNISRKVNKVLHEELGFLDNAHSN